ncbi:hypothetical protein, partial [Haloarcula sp. Atlit-7R]|uniref:hypothetical protein n=1 Tax=Haloarcula sp. Atlit-7R TaxID=2282125 RepID=UPI000F2C5314
NAMRTGLYMDTVSRLRAMDGDQEQRFKSLYEDIRPEFQHKTEAVAVAQYIVLRQDLLLAAQSDLWDRWTQDGEDRKRLKSEVLDAIDQLGKEIRLSFKHESDHTGGSGSSTSSNRATLWGAGPDAGSLSSED